LLMPNGLENVPDTMAFRKTSILQQLDGIAASIGRFVDAPSVKEPRGACPQKPLFMARRTDK